MSTATVSAINYSSRWTVWRWGLALLLVAVVPATRILGTSHRTTATLISIGIHVVIQLCAASLAYLSARSFDPGQTARHAWMLIALMPLTDALAGITAVAVSFKASFSFHLAAAALMSLSRIGGALACYLMVRLYRRMGFTLRLFARDYVAMAVVIAIGLVVILLSDKVALANTPQRSPELASKLLIAGFPILVALIPCAVLGVMVWRYATQMGGGLIAKAWRNVLLYAACWLIFFTYQGVLIQFTTRGQRPSLLLVMPLIAMSVGYVYLIFLGASYQYEACASPVRFEEPAEAVT